MEGEVSCSSISSVTNLQNVVERDLGNESVRGLDVVNSSVHVKGGRFDLKGKGIVNQRPRNGLRRRRQKGHTDYAKVLPVSFDPSYGDAQSCPSNDHKGNKEEIECGALPVDSGADANHFNYDGDTPFVKNFEYSASQGFELNEPLHEKKLTEKSESSFEEIKSIVQKELGYEGNEKNAIRILEQALEEEHAASAALYLELEKERSAAATAADQAMAMILRLQEEKASIGIEARQYQRIIEEKSAYDAEEMNILKEILLRRETEKHFSQKEVEAYRQMIYDGNRQLQDHIQDMVNTQREQLASSLDLGEDPVLMLQQLSESIDNKEIVKDKSSVNEVSSIDKQNGTHAIGEELRISGWDEESNFSKQGDVEKQFLHISGSSLGHNFSKKSITLSGEQQEKKDINAYQQKGTETKTIEIHKETDIHIPYDDESLELDGKDARHGGSISNPGNMILDIEPYVHDVHIIDGDSYLLNEVRGNKNEWLLEDATSNVHRNIDLPLHASEIQRIDVITDCPSTSGSDIDPDFNCSSDMTAGLPPLGVSTGKSILPDMWRNSMSAVDNERSKIDTEVEWLRERLRIVHEGRQKLNFAVEYQERENFQLQLLEDIVCQLQEIQQLTEPEKSVHQASLPLPSSKVMSKKMWHRSVSLGDHKSS